jgi:hypothetical protein
MPLNLSSAYEIIRSKKYQCLNISGEDVYNDLWDIFFDPLISMSASEQQQYLSKIPDRNIMSSFIFAINDAETKNVNSQSSRYDNAQLPLYITHFQQIHVS